MSRLGFSLTGWSDPGDGDPSLTNGWFLQAQPETSTTPIDSHPQPFTVPDCVLLCWRAKKLTFTYDVTYADSGPIPPPPPIEYAGSFDCTQGATDEKQLVGSGVTFAGSDSVGAFTIVPTDVQLITGQLWPALGIGGAVFGGLTFANAADADPTDQTPITFSSSSIPSLNGIPVYAVGGAPTDWTGTMSVEVSEWWPYDNGKPGGDPNGPIWDATSGDQLIFPLPQDTSLPTS